MAKYFDIGKHSLTIKIMMHERNLLYLFNAEEIDNCMVLLYTTKSEILNTLLYTHRYPLYQFILWQNILILTNELKILLFVLFRNNFNFYCIKRRNFVWHWVHRNLPSRALNLSLASLIWMEFHLMKRRSGEVINLIGRWHSANY